MSRRVHEHVAGARALDERTELGRGHVSVERNGTISPRSSRAPRVIAASTSAERDLGDSLGGQHGGDPRSQIALQNDQLAVDRAAAAERLLEVAAPRLELDRSLVLPAWAVLGLHWRSGSLRSWERRWHGKSDPACDQGSPPSPSNVCSVIRSTRDGLSFLNGISRNMVASSR